MPPLSNDYAGPDDLRRMQRLAAECARLTAPLAVAHVGDLPWRLYQHVDVLERVRIRLWLDDDGSPLAWAWVPTDGQLDFQVHPQADPETTHAVLEWFEEERGRGGDVLVTAWSITTDAATCAALEQRGYVRGDGEWYEHLVVDLTEPPEPPLLPDGYAVRAISGEAELHPRVAVHRAAFAPSRVVPESYRNVMRAWPYRSELDHVVVAPDGSFAAFALGWLDEENALGELEPVGTHPEHRRRGLASAVCTSTLRALHAAGARTCLVYSVGGSAATDLYISLGFRALARHVPFRRGIDGRRQALGLH